MKDSLIPLNEEGNEKLHLDELKRIVNDNWNAIHAHIKQNIKDNEPLTVQVFCNDMIALNLSKLISSKDIQQIKSIAKKENFAFHCYAMMLGFVIRDKYFEIEQIDLSNVPVFAPDPPVNKELEEMKIKEYKDFIARWKPSLHKYKGYINADKLHRIKAENTILECEKVKAELSSEKLINQVQEVIDSAKKNIKAIDETIEELTEFINELKADIENYSNKIKESQGLLNK